MSGMRLDVLDGVLAIDKACGMTSHDVVGRLRRITGERRIGHTGTLDPLATGLLMMCLGPATRVAQFLTGLDKTYTGTIRLGSISSTYDAEGDITDQGRPMPEGIEPIVEAMQAQVGERIQLAPPYSAVKVKGKKLYEYARAGEEVPQKARTVRIMRFDLLGIEDDRLHFEARVGSGTYVRSMAHDLGLALGCGAYLESLRRTRVGAFEVEQAVTLADLENDPGLLASRLLGIGEALGHLPRLTLLPAAARAHRHGQPFLIEDILEAEAMPRPGVPIMALDENGGVISIVQGETLPESGGMIFRALRVLGPM